MNSVDYKKFEKKGYLIKKNIINLDLLNDVKLSMINIMLPYVKNKKLLNKKNYNDIDYLFNQISRSKKLRSNIYKTFYNIFGINRLLYDKSLMSMLKKIGYKLPIFLSSDITAIEPDNKKYLLNLHQDLRGIPYTSFRSAIIWAPMSEGELTGGVNIYEGSHKLGPIKHKISENNGHEYVDKKFTKNFKKIAVENLKVGDCLIFSPFCLHSSIPNFGKKIRWTLRYSVDDAYNTKHLDKNLHIFDKSKYTTDLTNDERRKLIEKKNN